MKHRYKYVVVFVVACTIAQHAATITQEHGALLGLAERVCASDTVSQNEIFLPRLRIRQPDSSWRSVERNHPARIVQDDIDPRRKVYMIIEHCTDNKPIANGEARLIIAHTTQAAERFQYLTSFQGEFIEAGYARRVGNGAESGLIHRNPEPRVLAQFEDEKTFWLSKYGLPLK